MTWTPQSSSGKIFLSKALLQLFEKVFYPLGISGAATLGRFFLRGEHRFINESGALFTFPAHDSYYGYYLHFNRPYEPEIRALINDGRYHNFLDCGANYGYWSCLSSSLMDGKTIAVELDPETFHRLEYNCQINGKKFIALNAGLWDVDDQPLGINKLHGHASHSATLKVGERSEKDAGGKNILSIKIDTLIERYKINPSQTIIKVDVEGAEQQALDGAVAAAAAGAVFILEEHGKEKECHLSKKLLTEGWTLQKWDTTNQKWVDISSLEEVQAMKTNPAIGYNILARQKVSG